MALRSPPREASTALARFPARILRASRSLFRVHRAGWYPWWFGGDGAGRFDLVDDPDLGTCYAAEKPLGAFVEVFRDVALIDEADMKSRRVSELRTPRVLRLADCTRPRARAFGVTAAIHATERYALTQRWARAFRDAGFAGVRYLVSHDPSQRLVGVALFGPRGEAKWRVTATRAVDAGLVAAAERRFGLRVLPV